jgi:membrane protein
MALTAMNHPWAKNMLGFDTLFFKMAALPMAVLVLFLVYFFLPNGRPPLNRVIAAAVAVGILLEGLKYVNKLWWPWFQRKLETEYRIFQYSVALIFLGFIASMLVLAGAEWAARGQSIVEPEREEVTHV